MPFKLFRVAAVLLILAILFSNCAGVKIYSDQNLTKRTRIKYYHAKPYLLVESDRAKDVALKTTIIYLPDLANPYFVKTISGFGSSDLKLVFENGSPSSYGLISDSKVPETVTALAGLVTGVGGLGKGKTSDTANSNGARLEKLLDLTAAAKLLALPVMISDTLH